MKKKLLLLLCVCGIMKSAEDTKNYALGLTAITSAAFIGYHGWRWLSGNAQEDEDFRKIGVLAAAQATPWLDIAADKKKKRKQRSGIGLAAIEREEVLGALAHAYQATQADHRLNSRLISELVQKALKQAGPEFDEKLWVRADKKYQKPDGAK